MKKHNLWEKREESTNTLVALTEQTNFVIYVFYYYVSNFKSILLSLLSHISNTFDSNATC